MKKTILVTGGAGFIGSHLCERLVADGHRVISLDNYFAGTRENHVPGVEYREGHTKDIEKHVPESPDLVYHLGEYSRVAKSLEEPELVWDLNVAGTAAVLEFWRKRGSDLVYAGSSTKFAASREDGVEGRDLSPYTFAKAVNSELVANYARWYGLRYAIAYFYNVYGPRERAGVDAHGTIVETFRQLSLEGRPLTVREPGTQTRAFTHVYDTVDALVRVGEAVDGREYPVSAKEVYSLLDLARLFGGEVTMLTQTKSSRSTGAMETKELEELGWSQQHTLEDYIEECKKQV